MPELLSLARSFNGMAESSDGTSLAAYQRLFLKEFPISFETADFHHALSSFLKVCQLFSEATLKTISDPCSIEASLNTAEREPRTNSKPDVKHEQLVMVAFNKPFRCQSTVNDGACGPKVNQLDGIVPTTTDDDVAHQINEALNTKRCLMNCLERLEDFADILPTKSITARVKKESHPISELIQAWQTIYLHGFESRLQVLVRKCKIDTAFLCKSPAPDESTCEVLWSKYNHLSVQGWEAVFNSLYGTVSLLLIKMVSTYVPSSSISLLRRYTLVL